METIDPTIGGGWAAAALLFVLALGSAPMARLRQGAHLAMAGMALLGAVTLYSHDVMAMPQICAALIVGCAAGLLSGRSVPRSAVPALLAGLAGQVGLASIFVGLATWYNPHAFGLLDDMTDRLLPWAAVCIGLGGVFGALTLAGAGTVLWCGTWRRSGARAGHALFACALAMSGAGLVWGFVARSQIGLFAGCIGVALSVGHGLARWTLRTGTGPALALVGGCAGWALAADAFLLENMALAVAGGLAGAAGSLFALRLCVAAGRKGLADAGHHP